jgi:hypothetical protein
MGTRKWGVYGRLQCAPLRCTHRVMTLSGHVIMSTVFVCAEAACCSDGQTLVYVYSCPPGAAFGRNLCRYDFAVGHQVHTSFLAFARTYMHIMRICTCSCVKAWHHV